MISRYHLLEMAQIAQSICIGDRAQGYLQGVLLAVVHRQFRWLDDHHHLSELPDQFGIEATSIIADNAFTQLNQRVLAFELGAQQQAGCASLHKEGALLVHPPRALEGKIEPLAQLILGDQRGHIDSVVAPQNRLQNPAHLHST